MQSTSTSARAPRSATTPLNVTSPSAMSSSQRRRLPMPARARTFCSRSGVANVVRLQPQLERFDDVGAGHELAERGQLVDRVEPEALEEQARRAVEHGLAGTRVARDLFDEAALLQRADDAVDVDAADRRDLRAAHRLLVGDDGERLQRGGRQARRLAFEHEALDVGRQLGMALEAVATG